MSSADFLNVLSKRLGRAASDFLKAEVVGEFLVLSPRAFLGSELFHDVHEIVKEYKGTYVSAGKQSHWRIPLTSLRAGFSRPSQSGVQESPTVPPTQQQEAKIPYVCQNCQADESQIQLCRVRDYNFKIYGKLCPREQQLLQQKQKQIQIEKPTEKPKVELKVQKQPEIRLIPIDSIVDSPFQYRSKYDEKKIDELAKSIKEKGVIEPLKGRENDFGAIELVFGHRRLRAARKAGLTHVPVIVEQLTDEEAIFEQIMENLQREDVSDYDTGRKFYQLTTKGYSQEQIGKKIGLSKQHVSRLIDHYRFCELTLSPIGDNVDFYDLKEGQTRKLREIFAKKPEKVREVIRKYVKPDSKVTNDVLKEIYKEVERENFEHIANVEIRKFLSEHPRLISWLSYPDRGPFGKSDFPGNCSGWLLVELINHFKPKIVYDPMEGSGTSRDVCRVLGIEYYGGDIREGYNLLSEETEPPINDLTFFHPPYWDIIKYSEHPDDLSNCKTWDEYKEKLDFCIQKLLPKTKILAILIADIFMGSDNQFHSPLPLILGKYEDRLIRILVKVQEHYSKGARPEYKLDPNLIPVRHEYVILLKGDLL